MALYGRYQRVALTFLLWGFSFVHSSLIDYSCQNWEGYGKFLDVTFGDQPSLSKASCDQDVQLETFSDSPNSLFTSGKDFNKTSWMFEAYR